MRHHVQNLGLHRQVQKSPAALHAFVVFAAALARHVGADQFFRTYTGVVGNQLVERRPQVVDLGFGQREIGDQVTLAAVLGNFFGVELGHVEN